MRKSVVSQLAQQAAEPENFSPFDRFRDLTKRLVAVPKVEIDELQASDPRGKVKKRGVSAP